MQQKIMADFRVSAIEAKWMYTESNKDCRDSQSLYNELIFNWILLDMYKREKKVDAFLQGTHERLGESSQLLIFSKNTIFDNHLLGSILQFHEEVDHEDRALKNAMYNKYIHLEVLYRKEAAGEDMVLTEDEESGPAYQVDNEDWGDCVVKVTDEEKADLKEYVINKLRAINLTHASHRPEWMMDRTRDHQMLNLTLRVLVEVDMSEDDKKREREQIRRFYLIRQWKMVEWEKQEEKREAEEEKRDAEDMVELERQADEDLAEWEAWDKQEMEEKEEKEKKKREKKKRKKDREEKRKTKNRKTKR